MRLIQESSRISGNFSKVVSALAIFVTFSLPGLNASAANFNLGTFSAPATLNIGNSITTPGTFTDAHSFSVLSSTSLSGALASLQILNIVGISNFTSSLWLGNNKLATGVTQTMNYLGGAVSKTISTINYSPLLAGTPSPVYQIRTTGTVIGYGGWYGGSLALNPVVAAVPEPEIYAMMAIGMGVLGWAARRKKQRQDVVS